MSENELCRWKLLGEFQQRLAAASAHRPEDPTFKDARRLLSRTDYLSLFLFGLLNPCVKTMRALCQASHLERVQEEVCTHPVSLGSFSEVQQVLDPVLLEHVFQDLSQPTGKGRVDPRLRTQPWMIQDSTIWEALPRMHWALWRTQGRRQPAVRLHVGFHLLEDQPARVAVTRATACERAVWRRQWQAGDAYVGDRYFGEDYRMLDELTTQGCAYVIRLRETASIQVEEELPLSQEDREASVVRQAWVRLGCRPRYRTQRVRVVWVQGEKEMLRLVTNQTMGELSAELVGLVYRHRWQVELFFRWIKCILGNRHWLAESERGVTLQIYLALIAALLLQRRDGQRPSKRMMEAIQLYLMGWARLDELEKLLNQSAEQRERRRKKSA